MRESEKLEFKTSTSELKEGIISIASILNKHQKGELYFGIKKNGKVLGQMVAEKTIRDVSQAISQHVEPKIFPKIKEVVLKGKDCIHVDFSGSNTPYYAYGRAYIRVGDEDRLMSAKELERFILNKNKDKLRWDKEVCEEASYEDIDIKKVKSFLEKRSKFSGVAVPSDTKKTLEAIRGIKRINGRVKVTNLGLLFFGKNPQKFIAHSEVKVARFKGTDMVEFIDEARIKTTFLEALDEVEKFVKKNTRKAMKIVEFERVDIPEYPYEAIREALVNALAHRDYFLTGATIRVLIFDDRIEIDNPGVPPFPIKEIEGKHFARNEYICRRFHDVGEMEEYGTGITKMKKLMRKHGLREPLFSKSSNFFKVTFHGPKEKILDLIPSVPKERRINLEELGLNKRQIEALRLMVNENKRLTNKYYCGLFNVSRQTATRDLVDLVDKNMVSEKGKGRGAYYEAK